jgi:hypothetical protein
VAGQIIPRVFSQKEEPDYPITAPVKSTCTPIRTCGKVLGTESTSLKGQKLISFSLKPKKAREAGAIQNNKNLKESV